MLRFVTSPSVKLITYTNNPEQTIALACKICYANNFDNVMKNIDKIDVKKSIQTLILNKHFSPIEHASFTFHISNISRACMAQLTRHRIASFSVRSQRYINEQNFSYVIPNFDKLKHKDEIKQKYTCLMNSLNDVYKELKTFKVRNEDARSILPNSTTTQLIMTMNARTLHNFFSLRLCKRAQKEIRTVANLMLDEVAKVAPNIFVNVGPDCLNCTETDKPKECMSKQLILKSQI